MAAKALNWVLNIVSIVCAAFVIWQIAHSGRFASPASPKTVRVGSKLDLPAISRSKASRTVVLALSTYCQYCRASAGFYRALTDAGRTGGFQTIAVLRESSESSRPLLPALGIEDVSEVRQENLEALGALLLAAGGMYAAATYSLAERAKEIGIRLAMGAGAADIVRLIYRHYAKLAAIGGLIGVASGAALSRFFASGLSLFEVNGYDAQVFAIVPIVAS